MAEPDVSLLLEPMKAMQTRLGRIEDKIDGLGADMRSVKTHMAGIMANEVVQDGAIASPTIRPERIERRLDLRDDL